MVLPLQPKIAIVYDWATTGQGGAERVLEVLHDAFPQADLYSAFADRPLPAWRHTWPVHTTFLQKFVALRAVKELLAPFFPLAFESLDLRAYDVVLSVTSAFAKGVGTSPTQLHICYLLTPPRFLYSHEIEYRERSLLARLPFFGQVYQMFIEYVRRWDQVASSRPDVIIPISRLVAARAQTTYGRSVSKPIYPPVSLRPHQAPAAIQQLMPQPYLLVVSRLVAYKRIDLAIQACIAINRTLVVVGTGPQVHQLQRLAGPWAAVRAKHESLAVFLNRNQHPTPGSILFLGSCTDEETSWLYGSAQALVMPGIEDFGITGLEAAQHGVPVILPPESGVAELLDQGVHAIYSKGQTTVALIDAIARLDAASFAAPTLQKCAQQYDTEIFAEAFRTAVIDLWKEHTCQQL